MAPGYVRPASPVPAHFRDAPTSDPAASEVASLAWREVFLDARLQQVIALALQNNRDLRVAMLNIEKARAQYRIQQAEVLPSVQAAASRTASRASVNGSSQVSRTVSAEVGFSNWELDLFGRLRSLNDQALETWLATAQTQRSTRMSLVAEAAADWLTVGAYQQRLALARKALESQNETLKLTAAKHARGAASGLDLAEVQTSVESARADVASYDTALAQARNALELVAGATVPEALLPDPQAAADAVRLAPLPASLSSNVLLLRPDVLYAEHTLKAANADIGAARAAFFPSISLTAAAGRSSTQLSSLFGGGARTWSFVPTITVPIFQGGALQAELDAATIGKDINVAQYEKAIQTAFSEAADALAARARINEQIDAQTALVAASQRRHALALARYQRGVDSYLEALDAQRSLYSAQQALVTLQLQEAANRVTIYKVLGGGADAQPDASLP
ncbi:efflux transporter outer membrane subunit [Pseudorhodoferax sp.]|uniref:efflux transporter outer membrane subunit n=1 Tax=Pseudorhodoferax sp. TaxID=1993553 RepID=UPI0039E2715E